VSQRKSTLKNIKAIIHDWDDTVTDSFNTYSALYSEYAEAYNLPAPQLEQIKSHWGNTVPVIINGVWPEVDLTLAEKILTEYKPKKAYDPPIFPGARDALELLKKRGYILGVLTSGNKRKLQQMYRLHFGEDRPLHDFMIAKEDNAYHKPDPRALDQAMEKLKELGIAESQTIYVGDHPLDLNLARNRGIGFVAITTGIVSREQFLDEGMSDELILDSLSELTEILPQLL
jgi:phosphoglycolate phosphatase